jgi:hypothetical protein
VRECPTSNLDQAREHIGGVIGGAVPHSEASTSHHMLRVIPHVWKTMMTNSKESAVRISWEDVAIVREEQLASFATMQIVFVDDVAEPAAIASSDDSCSSDSTTESDESVHGATSAVSEFIDVTLSKGGRVQFSTIEVREYAVAIGDHPMVDMYPITLDWPFIESEPQSIDDYESSRVSPATLNRRGIKAPRLTATERMARLANVTGCSNQELFQQERKRQLTVQEEKRRAATVFLL